ncbi:hypothetical protein N825_17550 [Skermanella stibiiresistens SB22]|uniref:AAA domain-containing protein n=1 Tax=Skermanella stibiiresistens SB22 TaxID=1385369 RepID=W9GU35_9PROT|nr:ParA family protein [Skermanella stibiiresistens]EWY37415.1 hypothetical protein N825_17550 [Skermanella stibiiresistens SB22]
MKTIAFFGIQGRTGKTTLVYHLAWMMAERGLRVMMVDLDPQADLTVWSLGKERVQDLLHQATPPTISSALAPLVQEHGNDAMPIIGERLSERIVLLPGDLGLSQYDNLLWNAWHRHVSQPPDPSAFHRMNAMNRMIQLHAQHYEVDVALVDLAPNLGAINQAALTAMDDVVFPLIPDFNSVLGLRSMGPALKDWRMAWKGMADDFAASLPANEMPRGETRPIGYVLSPISMYGNRPAANDQSTADAIEAAYVEHVTSGRPLADGANCLGQIKNYQSLVEMAREAHKPMFHLRPADGTFGGHQRAAQETHHVFAALAQRIANRAGLRFPDT